MNKQDKQLLTRYANSLPKGDSERVAILWYLKTAESFEESVKNKTFSHPKTKEKVKFKSLPPEEQKKLREQHTKNKQKDSPEKEKGSMSDRVKGWLSKAKNLTAEAKKTLSSLPEKTQKFVADPDYRKEVKKKAVDIFKKEKDGLIQKAITSTTTQFTDVTDGVQAIMGGGKPTAKQVKATIKLALKVSAAAGVAGLAGGVGTAAGAVAGGGTLVSSLFVNTIAKVFNDYSDLEKRMTDFIKASIPDTETLETKYKNLNDWINQAKGVFEEMGVDFSTEELIEGAVGLVTAKEEQKADKDTLEFIGILSGMMLEMASDKNMSDEMIVKTLNNQSPSSKKVAERYLNI